MSTYSGIELSVTKFAVLYCVTIALQFTHCTARNLYTSCPCDMVLKCVAARVSSEKYRYEVGMFVKCICQNLRHHLCDKSVVTLAFWLVKISQFKPVNCPFCTSEHAISIENEIMYLITANVMLCTSQGYN